MIVVFSKVKMIGCFTILPITIQSTPSPPPINVRSVRKSIHRFDHFDRTCKPTPPPKSTNVHNAKKRSTSNTTSRITRPHTIHSRVMKFVRNVAKHSKQKIGYTCTSVYIEMIGDTSANNVLNRSLQGHR